MIDLRRPCLADIVGDTPLNAAEKRLIEACETGEVAWFGGERPTVGTNQNTIRAALIRHILLGGCDDVPVHTKGVQIVGAWVTDVLDLEGCDSTLDLGLAHCHICDAPTMRDARLGSVMLPGCAVPGLETQQMKVVRSVLLNKGFKASGPVNLSSVAIGGALDCSGGRFDGKGGSALNCDAIEVGADVFMGDGFVATGHVILAGAQIGGDLRYSKAKFQGILGCEGMTVDGGLYWQDVTTPPKVFNLTDAHIGALRDDVDSWQGFVRFSYDRIISQITVQERLVWLARKFEHPIVAAVQMDGAPLPWLAKQGSRKFDPQPYSQLATTLRAQAGLDGYEASAGWASLLAMIKRPVDLMFRLVFGYGHQTARAIPWVAGIWAFCFWLYGAAYNAGQMAPNSDVVLTSVEWQAAADQGCDTVKEAGCEMPLHLWAISHTATDYETFNRGLYALDLFVPLDALGQENAWAPSKDRGALGWSAYYLRWLVQMSGWIITAVGAAALTGVIGRKA